MGALALVDFDAGRFAHGLGDLGVACLMLSLMNQFPFIQVLVQSDLHAKPREELLREMEKLRASQPWVDRVAAAGWLLLVASLILRAAGAG